MIANIDDNIGRLLAKLDEWGIAQKTLIVFMTDNGGTAGVEIFNAGMRGTKATPWLGGTRAASFWRWPGALVPHDVTALAAHLDFFPTLAEIGGAQLNDKVRAQVEGRSLVPLLADAHADWPERSLFTHVGRWPKGADPELFKYAHCAVRTSRWHLVCDTNGPKEWQLFDVPADPGEQHNVAADHPETIAQFNAAYDGWWSAAVPMLINEKAALPKMNPLKTLYWSQFGGGPSEEDLKKMDPADVLSR
jgi:arylsulfatase